MRPSMRRGVRRFSARTSSGFPARCYKMRRRAFPCSQRAVPRPDKTNTVPTAGRETVRRAGYNPRQTERPECPRDKTNPTERLKDVALNNRQQQPADRPAAERRLVCFLFAAVRMLVRCAIPQACCCDYQIRFYFAPDVPLCLVMSCLFYLFRLCG